MKILNTVVVFVFLAASCGNPSSNNKVASNTEVKAEELFDPNDRNLKLELDYREDANRIIFFGITNLPNGTKLGVSVTNDQGFKAQDYDVFVNNNRFQTSGFSSSRSKLIGEYTVTLLTYFNTAWQDQAVLNKLNEYQGELIKLEKSEIFGDQKAIDHSTKISFGTQRQITEKKSNCKEVFDKIEVIPSDMKKKISELENIYSNNSKSNFEIKIVAFNRENHKWREKADHAIDNNCCTSAKFHLSIAITNTDLLGLAYSSIYRNGDKDMKFYTSEIEKNSFEAVKLLNGCRK